MARTKTKGAPPKKPPKKKTATVPGDDDLPELRDLWASNLTQKKTAWFVRPWVPAGELTIITGQPNAGKSTFGADLMSSARRTVVLPGLEERFEGPALARIERHGVRPENVLVLRDQHYTFPKHRERVARIVRSVGADLLWIDPLDNYMEDGASENDGMAVRDYLEAFVAIAHDTGAAVVGVRHPGRVLTNLLPGSRCWRAVPRMVLQLLYDRGPPERRICNPDKDSVGREAVAQFYDLVGEKGEAPIFRWGSEVGAATIDNIANVTDRIERWKVEQAEDFLAGFLAGSEQESGAVYKAAEAERLSDRTVRRAAENLNVVIRREGSGKDHKAYWSLPDGRPPTPAK